jgi:hypothetical protein
MMVPALPGTKSATETGSGAWAQQVDVQHLPCTKTSHLQSPANATRRAQCCGPTTVR